MRSKATIVLSIDGLSASMPGPWGNTMADTPAFNRLASISRLHDFCFVRTPEWSATLKRLWGSLDTSSGHRSLMTDCPDVAALGQSLEVFESIDAIESQEPAGLAGSIADTVAAGFFAHAVETANAIEAGDVLWLHHRGLYGPWDAPFELRMQFADEEDPDPPQFVTRPTATLDDDVDPDLLLGFQQSAYGQLLVLDAMLGLLMEQLASFEGSEQIELILISPRGYPLGEHGLVGLPNLHNESIHVPFLHCPSLGKPEFGSRFGELCFLDRSIESVFSGNQKTDDWLVSTMGDQVAAWNREWKVIFDRADPTGSTSLFARPDDRWEVNDVSRRCRDVADTLAEQAMTSLSTDTAARPTDN